MNSKLAASALPVVDSLAFSLLQAAQAVESVQGGHNLGDALASVVDAGWPPATRGAVQDLAYGTLRDFGRGDFLLAQLLQKPLSQTRVRALLLVALHRLETHLQSAHTTVDQAVTAAATLQRGAFKSLVNAVLRNFLRRCDALLAAADADPVAYWRHPRWWIELVRAAHGDAADAVLAAGNMHPPMALRVNRRRADVERCAAELAAADLPVRRIEQGAGRTALLLERPVPVSRLPGFAEGRLSVQDIGAQYAAPLLDAAPGMRVLDACAAPGGKAAHILESLELELTALEVDAVRAQRIESNFSRLGLQGEVKVADCRELAAWWDGRPFERVLADVPCSASGVVRRHPDAKWLRRESDIARFAAQQREIIEALWRVLAPGGKMLYATCSVFPQENQEQVAEFCASHADCMRLAIDDAPECSNGSDRPMGTRGTLGTSGPVRGPVRSDCLLLPTATHDGFYYALLQKRI